MQWLTPQHACGDALLRSNGFGATGVEQLATLFVNSTPTSARIVSLNLANNRLTDQAADALAAIITESVSLQTCVPERNSAAASAHLTQLRRLNLTHTSLGERALTAIAKAMERTAIQRIMLSGAACCNRASQRTPRPGLLF
jgi:hypothetical protein